MAYSQPKKITERDQGFFQKIKKEAWNQKLGYTLEFENHNSSLLTTTYRNSTSKVKIQEEKRTVKLAAKRKDTSLGKTLMLRKIESKRRRGQQRMRCLDSITDSMDMNLSKLWEIVEDRGALACCSP